MNLVDIKQLKKTTDFGTCFTSNYLKGTSQKGHILSKTKKTKKQKRPYIGLSLPALSRLFYALPMNVEG